MPVITMVDHAAIKTGQVFAIATLMGAFVLGLWEPVAALAGIFLITAIAPQWGPFTLIYRWVLEPLNIVHPDYRTDNPQPHQFGQAVGALSAALTAALLYYGHDTAGWVLLWVLVGLTLISYMGWCIGCFIYYQLNRLGIKGFFRYKPTDATKVLGARPGKPAD